MTQLWPSMFRDPFSSYSSYSSYGGGFSDPRTSALAGFGYLQGMQQGLAWSNGQATDRGLDMALSQFLLGGGQQQNDVAMNPALAFALRGMLQQLSQGMAQGAGMPGAMGDPQALQNYALLIELMAMSMMLGQIMGQQGAGGNCGCRALNSPLGANGGWGPGRQLPGWNPGGMPGDNGSIGNGPYIPPSGDMPRGSSMGDRLAYCAAQSAQRRGTVGMCYAGAKEGIARATGVQLTGGSAYMAADQLARSPQFREVRVSPDQLRNLPPGAVVVWGRTGVSPHGHISVSLGNGREASDHIQRQMTALRGHQNYRVFVPADAVGGGDRTQYARNNGPIPPADGRAFAARGTGYYPDSSAMEGGYTDRRGRPLHTLQDFLAGRSSYVSVAMDSSAFPYGTRLRIPELEQRYGRQIDFRVVDTGGAFRGRGTGRIDICTANRAASLDPTINGRLTLVQA